jgi:hypothetical protein
VPPEQVSSWLGYLLGPFGLTVGLIAMVWALVTERLVPGTTHRRVREERNEALRLVRGATRTTRLAVQAVVKPDLDEKDTDDS